MENLFLKWIDYQTNQKYVIGALCRDKEKGKYYFKLSAEGIQKAEQAGFVAAILPFTDVHKIYESDKLFTMFQIRVPQIENYDEEALKELLEELDMETFDAFAYLRKTHGELETDHFILEEKKEN